MSRIAKGIAAGVAGGTLAAGITFAAMSGGPAGCVLPGTQVTVPSDSGAWFAGAAHSCVDGTWRPFDVKHNAR
jgi:hypothetical protein